MQPSAFPLIGAVGSSMLLATVFGALWAREHHPHLLRWTLSWLCAAGIRILFVILPFEEPSLLDLALSVVFTGQAGFWLSGTRRYSGQSDPVWWPWLAAGGMALLGLCIRLADAPIYYQSLPVHLLLSAGYVWTGALLLRKSAYGMGGWMSGGGLIALGVHTMATLQFYATGDVASVFFGERVLGVIIGLGIVFAHIDAAYDRIHHSEAMILHAEEGLLQLDLDGQPTEANPALARLLGYDSVADVLSADLAPLVGALTAAERLGLGLDERHVEWRRFDDQRTVWLTLRMRPHRDAQGMPNGYQVHVRDTTEARRLSERLQRSEKLNALGQLAGGIAHDFNNVLAVVQGSLELLDQIPEDDRERAARVLNRARRATERGAGLTRSLLDFARHRPERLEVLDLALIAAQSLTLFERTLDPEVVLDFEVSGAAYVKGDRGQFERVLVNLVLNASDAMPDGGDITVSIHRIDDRVRLEVRDTGPGVPPEHRERIFEPFFTTREGGTGLGLATVFAVVTGAGGTVDLQTSSEGTTFVVDLPASAAPPDLLDDRDTQPPEPRRRTVLIVDDEPDIRELAAEMLVGAGYQVLQAPNGLEALEVARINGYLDLLITDVAMPGMTGVELADALQRNFARLPVLFLTAYPQTDVQGLAAERRRFLLKPFRRKQLLATVEQALQHDAVEERSDEAQR